jgi:hexosaminidase
MRLFILRFLLVLSGLLISANGLGQNQPVLIPSPKEMKMGEGFFQINEKTTVYADPRIKSIAEYFSESLFQYSKIKLSVKEIPANKPHANLNSIYFTFNLNTELNNEGYEIEINKDSIRVSAFKVAGFFNAISTLQQILRHEGKKVVLSALKITDKPEFAWRGMLLDVCRHFFSKDEVLKYIDLLSFYKFNRLHWHLTDDQGWRIEIKKYPKLTEIGAWRKEADSSKYGGYYTQGDIKEIVAFAQSRGITIIPEIEMPGHSLAALASYPELSCRGKSLDVANTWGVFDDVFCPGKENTFKFIEDILNEVIQLFPSEYIHIGGDECPKTCWTNCPDCQKRIKEENLNNEDQLQSYFIKRIEKYLNSKGKKLIGWDEILEGGLAPNATVQLWRDWDFAEKAAKEGHDVIMSPGSHCYLNNSPDNLTLEKVYSFNPIPENFPVDLSKHILGGEMNLWTENIKDLKRLNYMVFPRALAIIEVLWNNQNKIPYNQFLIKVAREYPRLKKMNVISGPEGPVYSLKYSIASGLYKVFIEQKYPNLQYHYTLDGSTPGIMSAKVQFDLVTFNDARKLRIQSFKEGRPYGPELGIPGELVKHKAINCQMKFTNPVNPKYIGTGPNNLTDGIRASENYLDGFWQGIEGQDLIVQIDLGSVQELCSISLGTLQNPDSWIFFPSKVDFELSDDGKEFKAAGTIQNEETNKYTGIKRKDFLIYVEGMKARFIRVTAKSIKVNPEWHKYKGQPCWLFFDELMVN